MTATTGPPPPAIATLGPRVLSVGSAVLDRVVIDGATTDHPGGAALNVAVGIRRLGLPTTLLAAIADDEPGRRLLERLGAEGVEVEDAGDGRPTTIAESRRRDGGVEYRFSSPVPSGLLAFAPEHLAAIRAADAVAMSAMRTGDRLGALVEALSAASGLRLYDPNPRPRTPEDLRDHLAELEAIAPVVDLVKVARDDLELFFAEDAREAAEALLRRGARALLVTDGPRGAALLAPGIRVTAPSAIAAEDVVDPLGAGDATLVAAAVRLTRDGLPTSAAAWQAVLDEAMRAAAIACATQGGAESLPDAAALQRSPR